MNLDDYHREGREAVWRRNQSQLGIDADKKAARLKERFKAVSRHIDRAFRMRRLRDDLRKRAIWIWASLGVLGGGFIGLATASPWPIGLTIRHFIASGNCGIARAVDLAPAYRGDPGYWAHNDADDDGIACEPWPR